MHIAAVGWIYVVLMMAITEESVVAGIMTFLFYGVLPVLLILYVTGSGNRRRRRAQEQAEKHAQKLSSDNSSTTTTVITSTDSSPKTGSANPNE